MARCILLTLIVLFLLGCEKSASKKQPEKSKPIESVQPAGNEVDSAEDELDVSDSPVSDKNTGKAFIIMIGKWGSKEDASEVSRQLRQKRINCYIREDASGKFAIFVGTPDKENNAQKQLKRLEKAGIKEARLFAVDN